jgi:hypothetical protein
MPLATRPDRGRFKDVPALIPGAPAWPGEITGGLNFQSLMPERRRRAIGAVDTRDVEPQAPVPDRPQQLGAAHAVVKRKPVVVGAREIVAHCQRVQVLAWKMVEQVDQRGVRE